MNRFLDLGLTRRRLLRFAGILGGGLFVGGGCQDTEEATRADVAPAEGGELSLHRAIREHFVYLSVDDQVIDAFAEDLTRNRGPWDPETSPRPFTRFLASTDFFQNGADETRPLRYVSYYDPYVSTCYNPFGGSVAELYQSEQLGRLGDSGSG